MVFANDGRYMNPSRVDPALVYTHKPWSSATFLCTHQSATYICISVLYCRTSSLTSLIPSPTKRGGSQNFHKSIQGVFHSVDSERLPSMICMALQTDTLKVPMKGNAMVFSTRVTYEPGWLNL